MYNLLKSYASHTDDVIDAAICTHYCSSELLSDDIGYVFISMLNDSPYPFLISNVFQDGDICNSQINNTKVQQYLDSTKAQYNTNVLSLVEPRIVLNKNTNCSICSIELVDEY